MTRAGNEPAEDMKRAIRRAIELAGLEVQEVRMYTSPGRGRMVHGAASPADWPHSVPAIELPALVGLDGAISDVQIRCAATDDDPVLQVFNAPNVQRCECPLANLPTTLKEVWVARREVIARLKTGESAPIFDGKWTWALAMPDLP